MRNLWHVLFGLSGQHSLGVRDLNWLNVIHIGQASSAGVARPSLDLDKENKFYSSAQETPPV